MKKDWDERFPTLVKYEAKKMSYDSPKPSKDTSYFDMKNFYACVISGYLLYGRFKWLKNAEKFDVNSINENSLIEHILEDDLKYSDELHVLHNGCALASEKLAIPYCKKDYCKKIADEYEIKVIDVKKC